ncbi:radical SAM/SPASM domain-containing protein [Brevibacillus dissolubilis]|uniref:radical SAM/SPASM domain-containing protein n=1 Tax=Brevibacillus dissolubilis TaxID=1844116 RepID=UPI001117305C|nr:radical SAM protein [Brevibacillus dissolubilis]
MNLNQPLHFPSVAVYAESGDYIVHNHTLNSWVVFSPEEYEVVSDFIYEHRTPNQLIEEGVPANLVKGLLGKLLMYKIGYQGDKPAEYENYERMTEGGLGKIIPNSVYFVTSYRCNLSCIYCYAESSPERSVKGDLSTEEALDMIRQIKELGARTIIFTGGEPLLRPDIFELMEYSKELGLRVNIITNGTLINNMEKAKRLADVCSFITVSFDSLDKESHEVNRGLNTWEKAKKAIDMLLELGAPMKINQTVTNRNKDSVNPMFDFAREKGISVNVMPVTTLGRGDENSHGLDLFERRVIEERRMELEMEEIESSCGTGGCSPVQLKQFNRTWQCGHGTSEFSIDGKGNVFPCKLMHSELFHAGSIRETPLREIWENSPVFTSSRRRTVHTLPDCKVCTFREWCGGGCRGAQWGATGKVDGTHYQECGFIRRSYRKRMWAYFRAEGVGSK